MKRLSWKLLTSLAILALMLGITSAALAAPATLDGGAKEISAKALTDHECDDSEWHFVINQIDDESQAPSSIHVEWANGNSQDVSLDKFTGGVAHYTTTSNLDSTVTSATAQIYEEWDGQFNLSHGPCQPPEPQPASVDVSVGQCYWDGASYTDVVVNLTGEGTLTISGPGGPFVRTGDDTLTLTPGSYSWTFVPADGFELEGPGSGEFSVGECQPETDPASVSVELGSCRWDEQSGSQTPFSFDISGEGTFSINGSDYTSDGEILLPPGNYGWTFVPADEFHLVGPGSGEVEVLSCEPPPPGEAAATVVPYCGGGVNVTLANATVFVQHADEDPLIIEENGNYPLDLGDYDAWAEADEGFEFPEGATTKWEFTIERCPSGHEEPPTGPLDSIPLSAALPIAGSALGGLALLGSAIIRRKRQ